MSAEFEAVIGLEIHVQLNTKSKLFCPCPSGGENAKPNVFICPVCTGQPGTLPALNKTALEYALKTALALGCEINSRSAFARKNYFYPDLPKGYQISQHDGPLGERGEVELESGKKIRIKRAHIEEDAGKLLHAIGSEELAYSLVDFNRCGVALLEIVSEPDMGSADEAYQYLASLKSLLRWLGVSECDMEKGELRVDVNISLKPAGQKELGVRVEVKNLNSFKAVKDAIDYEEQRQTADIKSGKKISQETRLWDEQSGQTMPMRSKEETQDYLYFPEPDLIALNISGEQINEIKKSLPELALKRKRRFVKDYGLSEYDAGILTSSQEEANCFEEAVKKHNAPAKTAANLIINRKSWSLDKEGISIKEINPSRLAELASALDSGKISAGAAKGDIFVSVFKESRPVKEVLAQKETSPIDDVSQLKVWAKEAIIANPKAAVDFSAGNEKAIGPMVGAVMKKSGGRASPAVLNIIFKELLKK